MFSAHRKFFQIQKNDVLGEDETRTFALIAAYYNQKYMADKEKALSSEYLPEMRR